MEITLHRYLKDYVEPSPFHDNIFQKLNGTIDPLHSRDHILQKDEM